MIATRWWWVRHAPVGDQGVVLGRLDLAADLSGAAAVADLAARVPRGAVWLVTPLRRTAETAAALLAALGEAPVPAVEPDLVEQDFGAWQGRPSAEVYGALGADHPFWARPAASRPPGGESFDDLVARVRPAIARLSDRHAGRDIVAVAHAGTIRAAVALALDLPGAVALRLEVAPLSLTRLDHLVPEGRRPAAHLGRERDAPPARGTRTLREALPAWRIVTVNTTPRN